MTAALYISVYLSVACFVTGCIRRILQYAVLPLHLRWELYPVPHETPARADHGGSYFEEVEWWTKPRRPNRLGELRAMFVEILLFKTIWKSNPPLWWRSMLFHAGLYCVIAAGAAQVFALPIGLVSPAFAMQFARPSAWLGWAGLTLILSGAAALLWRRLSHPGLQNSTHPADVLHLLFISLAGALVLAGSLNSKSPGIGRVVRGALTFDTNIHLPVLLFAGLWLTVAVFAYIPYSQMAHFIGKYFAYHSVRWDDEPNRGERLEAQLKRNFEFRPTWSASHIEGEKNRTWAEVVSENPVAAKGARK